MGVGNARNNKGWLWLLSHKVVPVREWLGSHGGELDYKLCGHALESISHCFWNCTESISIWTSHQKPPNCGSLRCGNVVWGSIQGLTLNGDGWAEQLNPQGHGFIVKSGSMFLCDGVRPITNSDFFEEIWLMVACLSVWHIWINSKSSHAGR